MSGASRIFLKEMRDLLRDKRTRGSAFIGPFVTVFVMLFGFGFLMTTISKPSSQKVTVVARGGSSSLSALLRAAGVKVDTVGSVEAGKALILDGKAHVVLDPGTNFDATSQAQAQVTIGEYYNPNDDAGQVARSVVQQLVYKIANQRVSNTLREAHVDSRMSEPIVLKPHEVSKGQGISQLLGGILPYLIILWAFYGGLGAVSDLVAGEKEKHTLETLLITPVSRTEIALGKLASLATLCLICSLSSLVALTVVYLLHSKTTAVLFTQGLGLSPFALGLILITLLPTVLLFSSVLLMVSARARNVREAQSQLTLISGVFIMPAIFSQFIGYTDFAHATWVSLVPVLDSAVAVRQALSGEVQWLHLLLTVLVNLVLGSIGLAYTISLFKREDVLLRI